MTITAAEVVRHFLKLEALRPKYQNRKDELLSCCELPDNKLMLKARLFAEERDDVNPTLVWTVGTPKDDRYTRVASWKRERIKCKDIFTSGISSGMLPDIDGAKGNIWDIALGLAAKYSEFVPLWPLSELSSVVIVVAHLRPNKNGMYEVIDGAHRLVALCCAGVEEVEAYVAYLL